MLKINYTYNIDNSIVTCIFVKSSRTKFDNKKGKKVKITAIYNILILTVIKVTRSNVMVAYRAETSSFPLGCFQQQEQDPTNLYMANLPPHFKENDVDQLLAKFGQVVSTRILRDTHGHSKGVGFARMESREKCEQIIQVENTSILCNNLKLIL